MKKLQNKVGIVTGSAQGMGYAIAETLAKEGAKIVITDINLPGVEKAVQQLKKDYPDVWGIGLDVTNKSDRNGAIY